jgi:hypothetical protein
MPRIQTQCPRCKQPIIADVQILFDMNTDPTAKQKLLSQGTNTARCQACGYEGVVSTPVVYHDPDKELLLTYFPSELGLPINEQEKQIGPLINQVVNALPNEKRKGYLFQPSTMFTYQTLIDKVLEADGITKEMIDAQQKRIGLIQRLLSIANPEDRVTVIKQEEKLIDGETFTLLSTLIQTSAMQGDEEGAKVLSQLQSDMLHETEFGKKLLADSEETQKALKELEQANKEGLTREKLLEILSSVKSDSSLTTLVSLTRSGLDYQFFQILSERIEKAEGDAKQSLADLRTKLLDITRKMDAELKKRLQNATTLLEKILEEGDVEKAIEKHAAEIDEFFSQAVQVEFEKAHENNDLARLEKIQKVASVLEKLSEPPAEIEFIQKLLEAKDDEERKKLLTENADKITDQFLQTITSIIAEGESRNQSPELIAALQAIYKLALRQNMEKNLNS